MLRRDTVATVVLARGGSEFVVDLAVVDALARLQLAAARLGWSITLRDVCDELDELVRLAGLEDVLQVSRQPEDLEQVGVEEVVVPDDPVA